MNSKWKKTAFTLIELLVVISIIALLIGILLPALGAARRTANKAKNQTQVRGIVQNATVYAASSNDKLPLQGSTTATTEHVFEVMVGGHGNSSGDLSPELLRNPVDGRLTPDVKTGTDLVPIASGTVGDFSYAWIRVRNGTTTNASYKNDTDTLTPMIADRGTNTAGEPTAHAADPSSSVWNLDGGTSGKWEGSVAWGDGHGSYEDQDTMPVGYSTQTENIFTHTQGVTYTGG